MPGPVVRLEAPLMIPPPVVEAEALAEVAPVPVPVIVGTEVEARVMVEGSIWPGVLVEVIALVVIGAGIVTGLVEVVVVGSIVEVSSLIGLLVKAKVRLVA